MNDDEILAKIHDLVAQERDATNHGDPARRARVERERERARDPLAVAPAGVGAPVAVKISRSVQITVCSEIYNLITIGRAFQNRPFAD